MRTTSRILTVALATAAIGAGTAGTAFAARTTVDDRAGDVYVNGDRQSIQDSRDSGVDLKSLAVSHGTDRVGLTAKFYKLGEDATVVAYFRLNGKGDASRVVVNVDDETAVVFPTDEGQNDGQPYCTNQPAEVDLGKNGTISMSINRFCLGYPKSLRVAVNVYRESGDEGTGDIEFIEPSGVAQDTLGTSDIPEDEDQYVYTRNLTRG